MTTQRLDDREQLAWLAGFYSGEGTLYVQKNCTPRGHRFTPTWHLQISQAGDQGVLALERCRSILHGWGRVQGPYPRTGLPIYSYSLTGFEKVQATLAMMWFMLIPSKRDQFREKMNLFKTLVASDTCLCGERPRPLYYSGLCPRGHPYSGTNNRGARICRVCGSAKQRRYLERQRVIHAG